MSKLDDILSASDQRQMTLDEYMAIEAEEPDDNDLGSCARPVEMEEKSTDGGGNGFRKGQPVGHADFADFRAIFVGHGQNGKALVRVVAGWTCAPPAWPVSVPLGKLVGI